MKCESSEQIFRNGNQINGDYGAPRDNRFYISSGDKNLSKIAKQNFAGLSTVFYERLCTTIPYFMRQISLITIANKYRTT